MSADSEGQAVDFAYLESFCAGDAGVLMDVLAIFQEQAAKWAETMATPGYSQRDLAHTIKGASRGIGANALADAATTAEFGGPSDMDAVRAELERAVAEVEGYVSRIGGG